MKKTTLGYLEHDGRWLMMLRNKKENDQSEGKWLGVGGKFLPGEDALDCFTREVREETGFALEAAHFHGVVHFISDTWEDEDMYLYTSTEFSWTDPSSDKACFSYEQEPPLPECNEGTLHWIPKDKVLDLNLWEGDHLFLERLLGESDFGELTVRYEGDTLVSFG